MADPVALLVSQTRLTRRTGRAGLRSGSWVRLQRQEIGCKRDFPGLADPGYSCLFLMTLADRVNIVTTSAIASSCVTMAGDPRRRFCGSDKLVGMSRLRMSLFSDTFSLPAGATSSAKEGFDSKISE